MFWLRNKNNNFQLQTVMWRPGFHLRLRTKATTTAVQIISILAVFFFTNNARIFLLVDTGIFFSDLRSGGGAKKNK